MKTVPLTLCAVFALLLTGCLPESINPIAPPRQSFDDHRLHRNWQARDKEGWTFFHFQPCSTGAGPAFDIISIEHTDDGDTRVTRYQAIAARIRGRSYLSYREIGRGQSGEWSFARYDIDLFGRLRIALLDEDAVASAIRSGALKGTVKSHGLSTDVKLTESSERIAAFVGGPKGAHLFSRKQLVLSRGR